MGNENPWEVCKQTRWNKEKGRYITMYGLCRYTKAYSVQYHPYGFIFEDVATAELAAAGLNENNKRR